MFHSHKKLRVAVLLGGPSAEHEVSLKSGEQVLKYLPRHYEPLRVLIAKTGEWEIPVRKLKNHADVAFIALHGPYGEDGTVQEILESEGIPYTGSGARESALTMNKFLTSRYLREAGVNVPLDFLVTKSEWQNEPSVIIQKIKHYLGYPIVVKPNSNGSSVGVTIVLNEDQLTNAFVEAFNVSREAIIQEFIRGREVTCGVLDRGTPGTEFALLPTEIVPRVSRFFDYRAKYEEGGSDEVTPPRNLPDGIVKKIRDTALRVHRVLGSRGFSRVDMILDKNGELFVLESNTIPGLTAQSLIPKAAAASGITFSELIDRLIHAAFLK
ncbi:MAG: D-alanine--D-alanine ligase [Candidatus Jorgensenbacteria bacterium]